MTDSRLLRILSQTYIIGEKELMSIPVRECGEPLINIRRVVPSVIIRMTPGRRQHTGADILYAREKVCAMLAEASKRLSPELRLVVLDAYRPIAYQRMRYEQVYKAEAEQHPGESEEEIRRRVFEVVFPPNEDPQAPPPHATGGALDVTIETADGQALDFGSTYGIYDKAEKPKHNTNSSQLSQTQRDNRILLASVMVNSGFCNYPGEWWHFMYGDREYAAYEGLTYAIYGRADLLDPTLA
jgi:D-alanyl-D-alanine dipeptidase